MPEGTDAPKRHVAQAPVKTTACFGGCGATVEYRTTPRVYCPACKLEHKRASARVAMEKQRRKRGIPEVKGQVAACVDCGRSFERQRNAKGARCAECGLERGRARARESSARKLKTAEGRDYLNSWFKAKRKADPTWRVSAHMRVLMHRALGRNKAGRSWTEFVPYTLDQLMRHLERQFLPGMTWDNRDRWHIDHIRPLASFNYSNASDPGFRDAWALTNLRPLWKEENHKKGAKRIYLL